MYTQCECALKCTSSSVCAGVRVFRRCLGVRAGVRVFAQLFGCSRSCSSLYAGVDMGDCECEGKCGGTCDEGFKQKVNIYI